MEVFVGLARNIACASALDLSIEPALRIIQLPVHPD